ncbi:CubicO group peptidase, beta-lactamase class C family [Chitinophaga sp. YR627]|uniref:serine hydrolase domain-containing protein n=1 Tax=Chitinophaga sp. YR627 TaxID=1881041 RepID=UPI0008EB3829|nr:serine hydrolase domain-containing protein [Chitinophaga sp. YR627]SFO52128.1 CubicO group peptidase, beta-lactamase class C family [Chitinophaga sp. YR627]
MAGFRTFLFSVLLLVLQNVKAQTWGDFRTEVDQYAQWLNLPTLAVGIARGDSLIFFHSIGSAATDTNVPITPDHMFGIASLTKSFTSVVMQELEEKGSFALTDPVDKFPNKYFTKDRWTRQTTLAHILSQTSESRPEGTNFIYNGGKYNVVFNAFAALNPPADTESMTRPFTKEVERGILQPLKMTHTLVRYAESEHAALKKYLVPSYRFDHIFQRFIVQPMDITKMECGPGYGMMSSMADLVKYSGGLDAAILISKQRYQKITGPFYPGSPYGLGWFTCNFEGIDLNWAYGYGNADAALLLKVPSKNLTLILLSSCDIPSASTRLGYGNPLNSPLVCSFIRNFILPRSNSVQFVRNLKSIEEHILSQVKTSHSRIYIEAAFAGATVSLFSPMTTAVQKSEGLHLLKFLIKHFPADTIWQSPTAFDLIATLEDRAVSRFAATISQALVRAGQPLHPATLFYAGVIQEKLQHTAEAIKFFTRLAQGDAYDEQGYKFDALMKLARYFQTSNPTLSKQYLGNLMRYKEYINAQDDQYKEAKALMSKL